VRLLQILAIFFNPGVARREVERRAYELLISNLSSSQLEQFNSRGRFEVTGSDTGSRYVIRNMTSINIDQLNSRGLCVKKWCFGPQGNLAQGDVLLAQKVALECFENDALSLARGYTPDSYYVPERR
jgi:hypothetical protein